MAEKKKKRKLRALRTTDEEWKIIQKRAKKRHQTTNEFLLSLALSGADDEQKYIDSTIISMARQVYIIATGVVEKADQKWVEKIIQEAGETYPMFGDEKDRGEGDG